MTTKMQRQRRSLLRAGGRSESQMALLSGGDTAECEEAPAASQEIQGSQGSKRIASGQDLDRFRRGRSKREATHRQSHVPVNLVDVSPIPHLVKALETHSHRTKSPTSDESISRRQKHDKLTVPEFSGFSSSPTVSIALSSSDPMDFAEPPHLDREPGYPMDKDDDCHGIMETNGEDDIPPLQVESVTRRELVEDQGTNRPHSYRKPRVDPLHSLIEHFTQAKHRENSTNQKDEGPSSSGGEDRSEHQSEPPVEYEELVSDSEEERDHAPGLRAEILSQIASTDEDIEDRLDTSHTSLPQVSPRDGVSSGGSSDDLVAQRSTRTENITNLRLQETDLPDIEVLPDDQFASGRTSQRLSEAAAFTTGEFEDPLDLMANLGQRKTSLREEVENLIKSKGGSHQSRSLIAEPLPSASRTGSRSLSEVPTSVWSSTDLTVGVSGSRDRRCVSTDEMTSYKTQQRGSFVELGRDGGGSFKKVKEFGLTDKLSILSASVEISPVPSELDTELKILAGSFQESSESHRAARRSSTTSTRRSSEPSSERSSEESNHGSRQSYQDNTRDAESTRGSAVSKQTERKSHQRNQARSASIDSLYVETNPKISGYQPEVEPISPASILSLTQAGNQSNFRESGYKARRQSADIQSSVKPSGPLEGDEPPNPEDMTTGNERDIHDGREQDQSVRGEDKGQNGEDMAEGEEGEEEDMGEEEEGEEEDMEEEEEGEEEDIREEEEEKEDVEKEQCLVPDTQEASAPGSTKRSIEVSRTVIPDTQIDLQAEKVISDDESIEDYHSTPVNLGDKSVENIDKTVDVQPSRSEGIDDEAEGPPSLTAENPPEVMDIMEEPTPSTTCKDNDKEPNDMESEDIHKQSEQELALLNTAESARPTKRRSQRLKVGGGKSPVGMKRKSLSQTVQKEKDGPEEEQDLEAPRSRTKLSTPLHLPPSTPSAPKSGPSHLSRGRLADHNTHTTKNHAQRNVPRQVHAAAEGANYTLAVHVPGTSTDTQDEPLQSGQSTGSGQETKQSSQAQGEPKLVTVWQGEEGMKRGPRDVHGLDIHLNCFEEVAWEFRDSVEDPICKKAVGILATKTQREMRTHIEKAAKVKRLKLTAQRAERNLRKSRKDLLLMQKARALLRHEIYDYEDERQEIERIKKLGELDQFVSDLSDLHLQFKKKSRSPHRKLTDKDYVVFS